MAVERKKIWYGIGTGLGVYVGMRYLFPAAVPFLLGWMLASMVLPAARWMERRWKIRRGIGGGLLILVITVTAALLLWKAGGLLVAQVQGLLAGISDWGETAGNFLDSCCVVLENVTGISAEKSRNFLIYQAGLLAEQLQNRLGPACLGYLLTLVKGIIALGGGVLVVILFGTLVLKDMDQFRKWIRKSEAGRRIVRITGRALPGWRTVSEGTADYYAAGGFTVCRGFLDFGKSIFSGGWRCGGTFGCAALDWNRNHFDSVGSSLVFAGGIYAGPGIFSFVSGG